MESSQCSGNDKVTHVHTLKMISGTAFFFLSCLTGDLELRAFSPQELSIDRVNNAIVIGMKNSSQRATDSISDGNDVFYFATDKMIPCGYFLLFMELEVP